MRIELKKIKTVDDIKLVEGFFHSIFIDESGYNLEHYYESIKPDCIAPRLEYHTAFMDGEAVGVTGIYAANDSECWLGWFGVREEFRRRGLGGEILEATIRLMRDYGYKGCRLYTNKVVNAVSVGLYKKHGFIEDSVYAGDVITMQKPFDPSVRMERWKGIPLGYVPEYPIEQ